jgi:hypothetical protein
MLEKGLSSASQSRLAWRWGICNLIKIQSLCQISVQLLTWLVRVYFLKRCSPVCTTLLLDNDPFLLPAPGHRRSGRRLTPKWPELVYFRHRSAWSQYEQRRRRLLFIRYQMMNVSHILAQPGESTRSPHIAITWRSWSSCT